MEFSGVRQNLGERVTTVGVGILALYDRFCRGSDIGYPGCAFAESIGDATLRLGAVIAGNKMPKEQRPEASHATYVTAESA